MRWYDGAQWTGAVSRRSRLFDGADRPSVTVLVLVVVASVVASWLIMGWDLSTADRQGRPVDHSVAVWRLPVGSGLLLIAIVWLTWIRPRAWLWIGVVATVGVESWYTWRGFAGTVHGANMTLAGTMLAFGPLLVATCVPAWITSRLARRDTGPQP